MYVCQQKHILPVRDLVANTGSSFVRASSGEGMLRRCLLASRFHLGSRVLMLPGIGLRHIANAGLRFQRLKRPIVIRGFEDQVLMTRPDAGSVRV